MATRKTVDIYAAVDSGRLTDASAVELRDNVLPHNLYRGDELLLRFTLFGTAGSTTAFALPLDSFMECAVAETTLPDDYMAYSDDAQFVAADWSAYDKAGGKVSCRMSTNTTNMISNSATSGPRQAKTTSSSL
jgi:hypothetical protein